MSQYTLRFVARMLVVTAVLWFLPASVDAQTNSPYGCCYSSIGRIGPSGGEVAAVIVGAAVVIGVGTYFLARAPHPTGCVVSQGGALGLQGSAPGDSLYLLEGETGMLHAGERVKVIGRKHRNPDRQRVIMVSRVAKDYGQCAAGANGPPLRPVLP